MPLLLIFKGILSEGSKGAQRWGPGADVRSRLVGLLDLDVFIKRFIVVCPRAELVLLFIWQLPLKLDTTKMSLLTFVRRRSVCRYS